MSVYEYFLAFETISKAALLADPANNIENWPVPEDVHSPAYSWTEPIRELTRRPAPARMTMNADMSFDFDGFDLFKWGFKYWMYGQMDYVLSKFGDADIYTSASIPVTVQTFVNNGYQAYHAELARPMWGTDYQSEDGGYRDISLTFTKGVRLT